MLEPPAVIAGPSIERMRTPMKKISEVPVGLLRILLVHRAPRVLQRIRARLDRLPHCLVEAVTDPSAEARRLIDIGDIDAVITGLRLRDGSGFDLLPGGRLSTVPVIVLSRRMRPTDQRRAVALGAESYLCTHDMDALVEILGTLAIAGTVRAEA